MRLRWHNRTRLAKMAAIFAGMLTISLGLCGANFVAFARWGNYETAHASWLPSTLLVYTGVAEIFGILVGGTGLLIVACAALVDWVRARGSAMRNTEGKG